MSKPHRFGIRAGNGPVRTLHSAYPRPSRRALAALIGAGLLVGAPVAAQAQSATFFIDPPPPTEVSEDTTSLNVTVALVADQEFSTITETGCSYDVVVMAISDSVANGSSSSAQAEVFAPDGQYAAGDTMGSDTVTLSIPPEFQNDGEFEVWISSWQDVNCADFRDYDVSADESSHFVQFAQDEEPEPDNPPAGPGSISIADVQPGESINLDFQVSSDNPPMNISTSIGDVSPQLIEAGEGTVTFSYAVPEDAEEGDSFTGSILVTDQGENDGLEIPVQVTVGSQNLGEREGLTGRQRTIAETLDQACGALREIPEEERSSRQNDLIATCDRAAESDTPGAIYDGLAPDEVSAQGRASLQTMRQQLENLGSRITDLRAGANGFSTRGLAVALDGERLPVSLFADALGGGGSDDILAFSNWGFFLNGSAAFGSRSRTDGEPGFRSQTLGITAGLDYRFTPQTVGGVALGYTRTDTSLRNNAGGVDVDGYSLSLYGTHFLPRAFYVDGIATIGRNRYDTVRMVFPGPDGQRAEARPDGTEYALGLNVGYDFSDGPWTLGLQSSFDYVRVEIESYRERPESPDNAGAGSLLRIGSQTIESRTAELALQLSYAESYPWGVMVYSTRWGVEREFSDDSRRIDARFVEDPTNTSFSLRTDEPDRTYMNIGAGLTAQMARGRSAYLFLESVEGRSGYSLYQIDIGFRMEF